jgi:hypothetical protein
MSAKTIIGLVTFVAFAACAGQPKLWTLPDTAYNLFLIFAGLGYAYLVAWPAVKSASSGRAEVIYAKCPTCGLEIPHKDVEVYTRTVG